MIIVAIYDKKAKTYDQPVAVPNAMAAIRGFAEQMSKVNNYAEDFELHWLANFENNETEYKVNEVGQTEVKIIKKAKLVNKEPFTAISTGEQFKLQEVQTPKKK